MRKRKHASVHALPVRNVRFEGGFWEKKFQVYRENAFANGWFIMDMHTRPAFLLAAGLATEGDKGNPWEGATLGKHIETVALSLNTHPDPAQEARIDYYVDLMKKAQEPDGYLHPHMTNTGKPHWSLTQLGGSHEGYVRGHLTEAALAYFEATGKREMLDIMIKACDEAYHRFLSPGAEPGFCGHPGFKMALMDLYRQTGEERYLELAQAWVEWRGREICVSMDTGNPQGAYAQDHASIRQQYSIEGHAVRAVFFAAGVVDLALETGDSDYRLASNRLWDSAVLRRMYITGSVGTRDHTEGFGEDYELPNATGYAESCAANGLIDFAHRMFKLERTVDGADVMERIIYNALLHSISLDGKTTYYKNRLSTRDDLRNNCWVCCPPSITRTLFRMGRYAYGHSEKDLWINLFVAGKATVPLAGGAVDLCVATEYPWDGRVTWTVTGAPASRWALHLRIPAWCHAATLTLNGRKVSTRSADRTDKGYVRIARMWKPGDTLQLDMEMPVERMEAHPAVADCVGKVAIQRGPVVYGVEGVDNGGSVDVELGQDPQFITQWRPDLLDGVVTVAGASADGRPFLAIPFYAMANRGNSSQEVWLRQQGMPPHSDKSPFWLAALYRPLDPGTVDVKAFEALHGRTMSAGLMKDE
jgi:DUF1680 family protein